VTYQIKAAIHTADPDLWEATQKQNPIQNKSLTTKTSSFSFLLVCWELCALNLGKMNFVFVSPIGFEKKELSEESQFLMLPASRRRI
jgi:hypothetical protein